MSVSGLIGQTLLGDDVRVVGYIVINATGSQLCAVLLESFPPQCGGDSVEITGLEVLGLDLEEEQDVRWTDTPVVFRGRWSDEIFTALEIV